MSKPHPEPDAWTPEVLEVLLKRELKALADKYNVPVFSPTGAAPTNQDYVDCLMAAKSRLTATRQTGGGSGNHEMKQEVHSIFKRDKIVPWMALTSLLITTYITIWSVAIDKVRFTPDRIFPFPVCKWRFPTENQARIEAPFLQEPHYGDNHQTTLPIKADLRGGSFPSMDSSETTYKLYFFVIDVSGSVSKHKTKSHQPWIGDSLSQFEHRLLDSTNSAEKKQKGSGMLDASEKYLLNAREFLKSVPEEFDFDRAAFFLTAAKLLQMEQFAHRGAAQVHYRVALLGDNLVPVPQEPGLVPVGKEDFLVIGRPSPLMASDFAPLTHASVEVITANLLNLASLTSDSENDSKTKALRDKAQTRDTNFEALWKEVLRVAENVHPGNHAHMDGSPPVPEIHLVIFSDFVHDVGDSTSLRLQRDNRNRDILKSWLSTRAAFKTVCSKGFISLTAVAPDNMNIESPSRPPESLNMLAEASVLLPKDFYRSHRIEEFALATSSAAAPVRAAQQAVFYHNGAGDVETHLEIPFPTGGQIEMRWFVDSAPLATGSYSVSQSSVLTDFTPVSVGHLYANEQHKPLVFDVGAVAPQLTLRLESPPFEGQETVLISSANLPNPVLLKLSCEEVVSHSISWVLFLIYIAIWLGTAVIMALILGQKTSPKSRLQATINWSFSFAMAVILGSCLPVPFHASSIIGIGGLLVVMIFFAVIFWARHLEEHQHRPSHS